jgi:preprotein translocase subunit SecF
MKFLRYKWIYFVISAVILIPGLVSLGLFGLKLSLDFTGGSVLEISTGECSNFVDYAKEVANNQSLELESVQSSSDKSYLLKFKPISSEQNEAYKTELDKQCSEVTELRFETVGPVIGQELATRAILAIAIASGLIVTYIAWSFRTIPKPYSSWKFGLSAVAALIHDALVVLGIFSLFGRFLNVEVDALFVTAMLTILGFSVHDTIVVFDRVRENLPKMPTRTFEQIVDFSLNETLVRSLNTSITVVLTLTALVLFGGESIRWFVIALLIGIVSGTYSSIFNASPILAMWESKNEVKAK